jgi:hypothetical protein
MGAKRQYSSTSERRLDAAFTNGSAQEDPFDPNSWDKEPAMPPEAEIVHDTVAPDVIAERQGTHGGFTDNAALAQLLKEIFRGSLRWCDLTLSQREALLVRPIRRIARDSAAARLARCTLYIANY